MAEKELGVGFDIHGGGIDLVFPHHENEVAQTQAARGAPLAKIWMHNGMLELTGEKMAKSVGNIRSLADVLDQYGGPALVMYFSGGHYRQPIAFSDDLMQEAQRANDRIREAGRRLVPGPSPDALRPYRDAFFAALRNDFNTPEARAALFNWVREANRSEPPVGDADLREMLTVLGLESLLEARAGAPPEAVELAGRRDAARKARDFAEADRLRDELRALGWEVRDGPEGAELVPA
jgi:cysteinyl-tRNA synthetase